MRLRLFSHYDSSGLPDINFNPSILISGTKEDIDKLSPVNSDQIKITENEIERLTNILNQKDFSILRFTPGNDIVDHDGKISGTDAWFKTNGLSITFSPFQVQEPEKFLETLDNYLSQFDLKGWDMV